MLLGHERSSSSCSEDYPHSRHGFAGRPITSVMSSSRVHPFASPKLMKSLSQGDGLDAIPGPMHSMPSQLPPPIPPRNQSSRILAQCSPRSPPRRLYQQEDRFADHHDDYRHGNLVSVGYALQHHRQWMKTRGKGPSRKLKQSELLSFSICELCTDTAFTFIPSSPVRSVWPITWLCAPM